MRMPVRPRFTKPGVPDMEWHEVMSVEGKWIDFDSAAHHWRSAGIYEDEGPWFVVQACRCGMVRRLRAWDAPIVTTA